MKVYATKELFDKWIDLKYDIQSIASLVQNQGLEITEEDRRGWLLFVASLLNKIVNLREETLGVIK